jgi:hypothetical protein
MHQLTNLLLKEPFKNNLYISAILPNAFVFVDLLDGMRVKLEDRCGRGWPRTRLQLIHANQYLANFLPA